MCTRVCVFKLSKNERHIYISDMYISDTNSSWHTWYMQQTHSKHMHLMSHSLEFVYRTRATTNSTCGSYAQEICDVSPPLRRQLWALPQNKLFGTRCLRLCGTTLIHLLKSLLTTHLNEQNPIKQTFWEFLMFVFTRWAPKRPQLRWKEFSKVSFAMIVYSKCSSEQTFQNVYPEEYTFSKICSLFTFPCKMAVEQTFEKFCPDESNTECDPSKLDILNSLLATHSARLYESC